MKCPYTIGKVTQVNQYTYNDDGSIAQHMLIETKEFIDCRRECMAYNSGKCEYKGAMA